MNEKKIQVLFALSECVPFAKSGGLADVGGALPLALNRKRGIRASVIMPQYSTIPPQYLEQLEHVAHFNIKVGWRTKYCGINKLVHRGTTFYFIDNQDYFYTDYLYGYGDYEAERFAFFSIAVLEAIPYLDDKPDILHCHDWQTAMIPVLLKNRYALVETWRNLRTIFTIHNLRFQGVFGPSLLPDLFDLERILADDGRVGNGGALNFMKGAITYSDLITTVSPTYSKEILTQWGGESLEHALAERKDSLHGILNGIDNLSFNPEKDNTIAANFSSDDLSGKKTCKAALQKEAGLPVKPKKPIIGMIGRLTSQKGLDLVERGMNDIMHEDLQMIVLGTGDRRYAEMFEYFQKLFPDKLRAYITFDAGLANRIYAGSDMFLMPSLFEPCGLAQMISMAYGSVPIVRETGGLKDTVNSYSSETGKGNGFSFAYYNAHDMLYTIRRALEYYYKYPDEWDIIRLTGMKQDFSWKVSASNYVNLYRELLI
jgi:starch synthase